MRGFLAPETGLPDPEKVPHRLLHGPKCGRPVFSLLKNLFFPIVEPTSPYTLGQAQSCDADLVLEGEFDLVIEDLLMALHDGTLSRAKAAELKSKVVGYFQNNRHRMAYADYLSKGLPIATGVIESTCKTNINRRMEGSGMLWSVDGAEAMLKLRGVFLDELWDDFWTFRAQRERKRLYASYADLRQDQHTEPLLKRAA